MVEAQEDQEALELQDSRSLGKGKLCHPFSFFPLQETQSRDLSKVVLCVRDTSWK